MRSLPTRLHPTVFAILCGLFLLSMSAQTFAASPAFVPAVVTRDTATAVRQPTPDHGREAENRLLYARVRDGVYTVDGMVAKIKLNYDVDGANFIYLFVPGVGTAVVSAFPEPNALVSHAVVNQNELTFTVDGHHFGLTGVTLANGKGRVPDGLYVHLDRSAWRLSRLPMVGFGNRAEPPYEWPGALPLESAEESEAIPPVPSTLLPSLAAPASAVHPSLPAIPAVPTPVAQHPTYLR